MIRLKEEHLPSGFPGTAGVPKSAYSILSADFCSVLRIFRLLSDCDLVQMPDIIHILLDRTVGCEFSAVCGIQNCASCPCRSISVFILHTLLCCRIGLEVCQGKVHIRARSILRCEQGVIQVTEHHRVAVGVSSADQIHDYVVDILIVDKVAHRIIGIVVLIFDNLICGKSENEGVFFSNFLYDLNICTVHRSESQGAVQPDCRDV